MLVIAILKINKMAAPGTLTFMVSGEHTRCGECGAAACTAWLCCAPLAVSRERLPGHRTSSRAWFPQTAPQKASSCRCGPARTVTASSWNGVQKGCSLSHRDELSSQGHKVRRSRSEQLCAQGAKELVGHPASAAPGGPGSLG